MKKEDNGRRNRDRVLSITRYSAINLAKREERVADIRYADYDSSRTVKGWMTARMKKTGF